MSLNKVIFPPLVVRSSYAMSLQYQDDEGDPLEWPLPAARFEIRRYQDGAEVLVADSTTGHITMNDQGQMSIEFDSIETDIMPSRYQASLMLYDPSREGSAVQWLGGPINAVSNVALT